MALKIFISDYTYRTEHQQASALAKLPLLTGAAVYTPKDFSVMFRQTSRPTGNTYYAASVACFASDEEKFKWFIGECRKVKACLASVEEDFTWTPQQSTGSALKAWKEARKAASGKVGARISGDKRKAKSAENIAKIKARWPLPNSEWSTKALLKEAGVSLNTAKAVLGRRPIEQANYQAKLKRKANAKR